MFCPFKASRLTLTYSMNFQARCSSCKKILLYISCFRLELTSVDRSFLFASRVIYIQAYLINFQTRELSVTWKNYSARGRLYRPVHLSFLAKHCPLFNFVFSKRSCSPPKLIVIFKTVDPVFHIVENLRLEIIIASSSRVSPRRSDEYFRWVRVYVLEEPAPATNSISFVSRNVSSLFRKSFRSCRVSYNLVVLQRAECRRMLNLEPCHRLQN